MRPGFEQGMQARWSLAGVSSTSGVVCLLSAYEAGFLGLSEPSFTFALEQVLCPVF